MVEKWFEHHQDGISVPQNLLPKLGIIVEVDGVPSCAGWVYHDNSIGVAWLAWLVTNPENGPIRSADALEYLIGAAGEAARANDYGVIFTMTEKSGLGALLKRNGFKANHKGMTQYFKPLTD